MLNVKQESCEYQLLKSFGLLGQEIEPMYTDYEANALTTSIATRKRTMVRQKYFRGRGQKYTKYNKINNNSENVREARGGVCWINSSNWLILSEHLSLILKLNTSAISKTFYSKSDYF